MDPFHDRLARVGLAAIGKFGFCLAGGYAVQAHGSCSGSPTMSTSSPLWNRPTGFLKPWGRSSMRIAQTVSRSPFPAKPPTFARLEVSHPGDGAEGRVELGVDWRAYPPAHLEVGPVLHPDDAVANKVCALFGRAEVRDYIDVDGIVRSGRYSVDELLRLAAEHDPGFVPAVFADALAAVRRLPFSAFERYGMSQGDAEALLARIVGYAKQVREAGH